MAHLLMIESWVGGTGRILPPTINRLAHQYTLVTRRHQHYLDNATHRIHPVLEYAHNVLTAETNNSEALIEYLHKQHSFLHFDGVLTVCDYYIDIAAQVAQALDLPHPFSTNVALVRQKHHLRQMLTRAGLPNPAFEITSTWEETRRAAAAIGYPLVVKPTDLASSAFVRCVHDDTELLEAFSALDAFPLNFRQQPRERLWLLEEFMQGPEVSVEACTYRGDTTVIGITDKSVTGFPFFIENGHMFPADLDSALADATIELVIRALQVVGYDHGISHTEVKLTADGPRIVEINPRPAGNYIVELVQRVTGIDLLGALIDLAIGQRPNLTPSETGITSAAIQFIVPPCDGYISNVSGTDQLNNDPNIVRWELEPVVNTHVSAPIDNACYLGHVVTVDRSGREARRRAEQALSRIVLSYAPPTVETI